MDEYKINKDFRCYVDRYCKKHEITAEEALNHKMIQNVENYYMEIRIARENQ